MKLQAPLSITLLVAPLLAALTLGCDTTAEVDDPLRDQLLAEQVAQAAGIDDYEVVNVDEHADPFEAAPGDLTSSDGPVLLPCQGSPWIGHSCRVCHINIPLNSCVAQGVDCGGGPVVSIYC
ncbi:MAG: hypothetical protein K0V04_40390 [Deltaproteobacteria bacterium]|nr:hypothetical protein [Deltaproteobacteria bacterium]